MTRSIRANFTCLFLVFVPAVSACASRDIAGGVDAGAVGGQVGVGTGGASATAGGQKGAGGTTSTTSSGGTPTKSTGGTTSTMGAGGTPTKSTGGTTSTLPIDCSGTAPTALPTWATANGCVTGNEVAAFIGVWEGYIQGYPIGDESSSIRLNILGANSNGLCGTVTFGTHTAAVTLPPVTDPAAIYPPDSIVPTNYIMQGMIVSPVLGLPYTIQDGKIQGQRATFEFAHTEIFNTWCSLQTAYPAYGDTCTRFTCVPGNDGYIGGTSDPAAQCYTSYSTDTSIRFYDTCARVVMCGAFPDCTCNVDRCVGNQDQVRLFDLTFNNDQVTGTFDTQNVVLSRTTSACLASGASCNVNSDCCGLVCDSSTRTCQ